MLELPVITSPVSGKELLAQKLALLSESLREARSVVVGFSGGVDSTFLVKVARDVLGRERVRAVIGISESYPERELAEAMALAEELDVEYETVRTEETDILKFAANPPDRCYYCKTELFGKLEPIRARLGFNLVLDGTNADDVKEFRPGVRALREQQVASPLVAAALTKNDIRALSRDLGLSTADKPSFACLSSRFPYGMAIDKAALKKIDRAEQALHDLGFHVVRVRHHDDTTARVEIRTVDFPKLLEETTRLRVLEELKQLGFHYITFDLEGFRSGSMNELLSQEEKNQYL